MNDPLDVLVPPDSTTPWTTSTPDAFRAAEFMYQVELSPHGEPELAQLLGWLPGT